MILYHGSYKEISRPDLIHSRKNVDFGCGFYTTPIYEQAVKWCSKFIRRGQRGVISCYEFDEKVLDSLRVLKFADYSDEWLDFIISCRKGTDDSDYDIVIGGVANDKVFNTVELYFEHLIDKKEAIGRLKYEKPNLQICFRNQAILDTYLNFKRSKQV